MEQDELNRRKAIAGRIAELIENSPYSKVQIQEKMGYKSWSAVYKWTTGENLPKDRTLIKLAQVLGTTPEYIRTGMHVMAKQPPVSPIQNTEIDRREKFYLDTIDDLKDRLAKANEEIRTLTQDKAALEREVDELKEKLKTASD